MCHSRLPVLLFTGLLILLLSGCSEKPTAGPSGKKRSGTEHLVEMVVVSPEQVSSAHERTGSLRARRIVRIHNQEEGRITSIPFFEGDAIASGDTLVRLEDAMLRAQLDKARATTRQAQLDLKRIGDLVKKRVASDDEQARARTALDVAKAEQKLLDIRLSYTRITAPFSGVISERNMEPGDLAPKNSHRLTLTDPDSLVTEIHVSELLLPHLKRGDPVTVGIDALGNLPVSGKIQRIHPELDQATRQGVVEIALTHIPEGAKAGQFVRITFKTAQVERILLPFAAVRRDRDGEFVYRLNEKRQALRTPVRSGNSYSR
ncbi:efflux RND transporter periplasmic adaptor subunit [Candidatus Vondammii sp. HM_W22]|uniref:efflux RND transporter periplasmic adaptor subunit n=1 Tax=Candidatus Vondammii sp. HM_W22 TaxID=2687299 RepID=UPI001F12DF26|nr:efflux RND transporter periplasmic adaptor subunit [Candidatus Vondammii sp. HM_W22]